MKKKEKSIEHDPTSQILIESEKNPTHGNKAPKAGKKNNQKTKTKQIKTKPKKLKIMTVRKAKGITCHVS